MSNKWNELSPGQMMDAFGDKAEKEPGYAIAWALLQLADAQKRTAQALDRLGFNNNGSAPGTTEFIGMEMKRVADALESLVASRQQDD